MTIEFMEARGSPAENSYKKVMMLNKKRKMMRRDWNRSMTRRMMAKKWKTVKAIEKVQMKKIKKTSRMKTLSSRSSVRGEMEMTWTRH